MGYWGQVAARAIEEAARDLKLNSAVNILVGVAAQGVIGMLIFVLVGMTNASLWIRVVTAAAPFALFPVAFAIRLVTVPRDMHVELAKLLVDESAAAMRASHQRDVMTRLSGMYGQSGLAGDDRTLAMVYGFQWPPEDWMNQRLEEYGEDWRVVITGAKWAPVGLDGRPDAKSVS